MVILSATELKKEYGTDIIFSDVSFHANAGDRIGLVGSNGAGKTTLLDVLTGNLNLDGGQVFLSDDTTVGYLKQKNDFPGKHTVMEAADSVFENLHALENEMSRLTEAISAGRTDMETVQKLDDLQEKYSRMGGYTYKAEITGVLSSMAFTEDYYNKSIATLSGGEKTRLALACLLLKKPDLLLLDEPTNHLDIGTLKWLEQYLKNYRGTMIVVSHDRYFLDQTVMRIFELDNHKLYIYDGNYTEYAGKKRLRREQELKQYNSQQQEIKRQEDMIRRFKGRGTEKLAKRAASREKQLEKIQRIEKPDGDQGKIKLQFKENYKSGTDVIFAKGLSKSFGFGAGKRDLFENVNLDIKRGERICIVGPNGIGKTTLLRILLGELNAASGELKKGHNVSMGYYDQGHENLCPDNTVFDELKESYRLYKDSEMRSILGRFLFHDDEVFLPVRALSGGEKARLSLAKIMLSGANVLIFDEPTNHLDIDSKEVFEDALLDFPGTVITVSHDRYFLNKVPTRILELNRDGVTNFLGTYDYYVEKKQEIESGKKYLKELSMESGTGGSGHSQIVSDCSDEAFTPQQLRLKKKEEEAKARRMQRELENTEAEIMSTEEEIESLEKEMCREENLTDHGKLKEINDRYEEKKRLLDDLYKKWSDLQ